MGQTSDAPTGTDTRTPSSAPGNPTIRVAGLWVHEGRILMVEQGRGDRRYWLLPGGGVHFGETLADALRREMREELGLRVGVQRLLAIAESISPEPDYAKHVVHLVFEMSASADATPVPEDDSILTAAFFDELQLQTVDIRPPIGEFLVACTRQIPATPQYLGRRW